MSSDSPRSKKAKRLTGDAEMAAAVRATEQILAVHPERLADMNLPLTQYLAKSRIEDYRRQFEAGDAKAMLAAIQQCALSGIPMPCWVADAFNRAYNAVDQARVGSWDKAFGRPYKKGTHLAATRKKRQQTFAVLEVIAHLISRDPGRPTDVGFFEDMGAMLDCKATRAAELYYDAKKEMPALFERYSRKPEN